MKFVFDIDGTLCFNGKSIDPSIVDALLQLQNSGHELIFASARPIRDLLPVLPEVFHQHTLIGANGAMFSQQSNISVIKPIQAYTYHHILRIIQKYELDYIIDDDWNYAAKLDAENAIFERLDPHKLASCIDVANIDTPIKIILLNIEPYATNGYIVGPSEDNTHTILKLNHVTHIDSHAQAICSSLNLYE